MIHSSKLASIGPVAGAAHVGRRQFVASVVATAAAGFVPSVRAQDSGAIVLGQSCALTGFSGELGIQYHQGAQLFFDDLNARGGINGREVRIRVLDDGYEPERCAANTQRFIKDDVFALFGYVGTPTSVASLPQVQQEKIPLFAPLTGSQALRQPNLRQLVFNVRASYADETALMVRQLIGLGLKKIAVFYQNDGYGQSGLEGVTEALAQHALSPVATATVERNSADVKGAVQKLVAQKPDVIVQVTTYSASAGFVREARAAGYGGQFYNVSFVGTSALSNALGKEAEGVVVTQVVPSPFKTTHPVTREFLAVLGKGGKNLQPNYSAMEGFLAARILSEGLRRGASNGKLTRESLVAALDTLNGQQVAGFPVAFQPQGAKARFVELSMLTGDGKVRV
ncbi:ABC transporter substrate-binding protein [Diaphorobacter sp. HDW4A]|uniref:ABC transporter substrate-binding protein n=1 Tax=Diaphorobacter sp. HDW4A TaxID=2714924 RepID=UPI0014085618|nr:ABC transporter substrate-binding protein [Diaphorobacter sp. HDW4A]QIL83998.1 ABC transporter substrate-binding protein [Diaphorobacter sp. HDW4A]